MIKIKRKTTGMIRRVGSRLLRRFGLQRRKWVEAEIKDAVQARLEGRAEGQAARRAEHIRRGECSICRGMDQSRTERDIGRAIIRRLLTHSHGASAVWCLPSDRGTRLAVALSKDAAPIQALLETATADGLSVKTRKFDVTENLYEFDGLSDLPTQGHMLEFSPLAHCPSGQMYLPERTVTLELVHAHEQGIVIPLAGKGPRFYPQELLTEFEVTAESFEIVPSWPFPIDLVYTWVDSNDPSWRREYLAHVDEIRAQAMLTASASESRWRSRNELLYSLRSIEMYAPFIRNIYIVTNGQRPSWLADHSRVQVVAHRDLFPDTSVLPCFNSNAIETVLHRIPGLAEHFLYLNDDFLFSRACVPEDFFSIGGLSKLFFSKRFLDARPIDPTGRATVACHKSTRDVLQARFGIEAAQKFQHAPHALRKSTLAQIEAEFPDQIARTRANRVRGPDDMALAMLYGYYALFTGQAQKSRIPYAYIELGMDDVRDAFVNLEARRMKVFCLNDADAAEDVSAADEGHLRQLLADRYPIHAPWERKPAL